MNTNNLITKLQNITKYLSIASLGLGVFNTISNQTSLKTLRNNLETERKRSFDLTSQVNTLINKESFNQNVEINNNKLDKLNNKIDKIIENNLYENTSLSEINNSIKEINNDLVEIVNKIDETLRCSIIDTDIFNTMISYINSLNFFQTLAISHLFLINLIFILLIDLMTIYFGDYLINNLNIENKYPKIYKFIQLRRKFQRFYLIKDLIIIFITLISLAYINIKLFLYFSL